MSAPQRTAAPATVRVDRVVVRCPGDAAAGERLKERLPAILTRAFAEPPADARAARRQVERAVREAWR
jgi:hypothetical protein